MRKVREVLRLKFDAGLSVRRSPPAFASAAAVPAIICIASTPAGSPGQPHCPMLSGTAAVSTRADGAQ